MRLAPLIPVLFGLVFAPLLLGIINRTKALFAGRRGMPLLQLYYDVWKLLRKGAVYSRTRTWIFRAGPIVGLAAVVAAIVLWWPRSPRFPFANIKLARFTTTGKAIKAAISPDGKYLAHVVDEAG